MVNNYKSWLEKLGRYWVDLNPKNASELFSKDVIYYESALKEPLADWNAVSDLWKIIPSNQKNVSFDFEIISITQNLCVANWQVKRTMLPQNVKQNINGIFVFKLNEDGLCYYFKQWRAVEDF